MVTRQLRFAGLVAVLSALLLAGCGASSGDNAANNVPTTSWIRGIVTKARGEPVANATVTVLYGDGGSTTTDEQGRFNVETTKPPGLAHDVRVEAEGYLDLHWTVSSGSSTHHFWLVSLDDYNDALFRELTEASETVGTWRLYSGTFYVDRSGPWQPEFDLALRNAYYQWGHLTRSARFGETPYDNWQIHLSYVNEAPCGVLEAAGCTGILNVSPEGVIESAFIELHIAYGADVGVMMHEMGHAMGLLGHSQNPNDLMYTITNGMTSPSNEEAAVAAVLYANPPGTTMEALRFPPLTQLASEARTSSTVPSETPASTATVVGGSTVVAPSSEPLVEMVRMPLPGLSAVAEIVAMVRSWFGGNGCFLNLPLFCNFGTAVRIW